jgi:hypothetical protein
MLEDEHRNESIKSCIKYSRLSMMTICRTADSQGGSGRRRLGRKKRKAGVLMCRRTKDYDETLLVFCHIKHISLLLRHFNNNDCFVSFT